MTELVFSTLCQRRCDFLPDSRDMRGERRALDLALLLQHADAVAQRLYSVFELGLAMSRRGDAARTAAEVDPAGHHRQPEFVHQAGLALAGEGGCRLRERVEAGRDDGAAIGVGEDV